MEIVRWGEYTFGMKEGSLWGSKGLSFSASSETEDTTKDGQKFVKLKNSKPYEMGMTAVFSRIMGIEDVQFAAFSLTEEARKGTMGNIYLHGAKLCPAQFMLTDAKITNIEIGPTGLWNYAEVSLTMKQASTFEGVTSSSKSGGGKGRKKSTKSSGTTASAQDIEVDAITGAAPVAHAQNQTNNARSESGSSYIGNSTQNASRVQSPDANRRIISGYTR